jgi:predicted phage terminase large subunit-like protein
MISVLWNILFNRKHFVLIISESYQQSALFLDAIKKELEYNDKIKYFFGDLNSDKWSENDIVLKTDIKLVAKGAGQKLRGLRYRSYRPDLVILDDFESEANTETDDLRDKLFRWVNGAVLPGSDPNGEIILVGTIVHHDSYLENIRRTGSKSGWELLYYQAIISDEKKLVLWPDRFSYQYLDNLRSQYAAQGMIDFFWQEYQNIAQSPEGRPFTEEMIQYHSGMLFRENNKWYIRLEGGVVEGVRISIGVDPAIATGARSDYSVIFVSAIDGHGNIYAIEYWRGRVKPVELIEKIYGMFSRYEYEPLIVIETTAYQEALVHFLMAKGQAERVYIPIEEFKPKNAKSQRLLSLQPFFASKKIYIRRDMGEFMRELLEYPKSAHDDTLDAFYYSIQFLSPPTHTLKKIKNKLMDKYVSWAVL